MAQAIEVVDLHEHILPRRTEPGDSGQMSPAEARRLLEEGIESEALASPEGYTQAARCYEAVLRQGGGELPNEGSVSLGDRRNTIALCARRLAQLGADAQIGHPEMQEARGLPETEEAIQKLLFIASQLGAENVAPYAKYEFEARRIDEGRQSLFENAYSLDRMQEIAEEALRREPCRDSVHIFADLAFRMKELIRVRGHEKWSQAAKEFDEQIQANEQDESIQAARTI